MSSITIDGRCLNIIDGVSVYTQNLLTCIIKLDRKNQYKLIRRRNINDFGNPDNLKIIDFYFPGRILNGLWRYARVIPMELFFGDTNIFFSPNFTLPYLTEKIRTVITIHDLAFIKHPEISTNRSRAFLNYWVPRSLKKADRIISVSHSTKQDILKIFDIPESKITVIHEGCQNRFRPIDASGDSKVRCREKYKLPDRFILHVGTLEPRKNIPTLLKAFAKIKNDIGNIKLVLAGKKGWLYDEIFILMDILKLDNYVLFAGAIDSEDLPILYNLCEYFVFPSIYEGFGLPILEAMACGKAVVTSNISSMPEVGGDAVYLVDPNNIDDIAGALQKLVTDIDYSHALGKKGLDRAKIFTWEKAAKETIDVFNSLK